MTISSWLCTNSTKNMFIKIVHPGGHVELHDRPVLASEIMLRNPRCIVAYPHVFQRPWAIVAPETTLILGQKYYVVPIGTIRKLQRLSFNTDGKCPITCLNITATKTKENNSNNGSDSSDLGSSETKRLTRKKKKNTNKDVTTIGSPRKLSNGIDNWQPKLECITEE
ncbi:hypothetical protein JRO89_XS09G0003900 [Xanthoceras sorbifolium]|uniref:Uncharacterized protein n=1 Tax=Xanthoceras sorbifolium TaxID=99658 RepID=A0ABQ8HK72_9ROSI|nr:hypothetical protein JRO89_XS09G0003900 [Xanthoceras sorbifolium]